jgi:hypothetical protein
MSTSTASTLYWPPAALIEASTLYWPPAALIEALVSETATIADPAVLVLESTIEALAALIEALVSETATIADPAALVEAI